MITPMVSVIMPAYNCQEYITESITSVINQTYTNWELIVIDDGSTDETLNRIKALQSQDSRIRLYQNPQNIGVAKTRNKAISLAQGEWIAFLDSDDVWYPEKLDRQLAFAEKQRADFVYSGAEFINESGKHYKWYMQIPSRVTYKKLLKQNVIICSSVLLKKTLLAGRKMLHDTIHEDFCLWLDIFKTKPNATGINQPLLSYRISSKSKSGNKIKSATMTYWTYRCAGLGFIKTCYYMLFYMINGIYKYHCIFSNGFINGD